MNMQRPYSNPYLEVEAESGQTIINFLHYYILLAWIYERWRPIGL